MYRTPQQVRILNVLKGLVLAGCFFTAVWLIYNSPPTSTAVTPDPTPDPTTSAVSDLATPVATITPTSEEEAESELAPTSEALPTLVPTAVVPTAVSDPPTPTAETITIPPPTPTLTASLSPTSTPTATVVATVTTTAVIGEAEAPPAIIPPDLPVGENAPPLVYYPSDGQLRTATDIDLLGIAQPNSTLELLINDEPFALIPVQSLDGRWFYTYPTQPGEYRFTVRYLSDPTRTSETIAVTLVAPAEGDNCVDPTPGQDLGASYIVGDCEWLLGIARKLNIEYTALLNLNPEIQNPNFLISGQRLRLPARNTDSP